MDEHDPVAASEFVYRRIHSNFFDATLAIPVRELAFRPTDKDTEGLSVFRAHFLKPAETLSTVDPSKADQYYVARLALGDLQRIGLTVQPDPIPGGPAGHAVIPELSWLAYQARKQHWKPILVELAKLAGDGIVHSPG